MKAGLIGAGGMGAVHSQAYLQLPGVQVSAVMDIRPEVAQKAAALHGARVYTSLDDLLANEPLDMVDICTPSHTHAGIALRCLEQKLNVLVEKPIAMTLPDAEAMIAAAARNRVMLMTAQVIRFWPEYSYLKRAFDLQTYGQLLQITFTRTSGAPKWCWDGWYVDPSRSGLAPFEMHIHDLDFIHYLLGRPRQVRSVALNRIERDTSYIRTQYFYEKDWLVEAEGSWCPGAVPFSHTYRAVFEEAVLDFRSDQLWLYARNAGEGQRVDLSSKTVMGAGLNLQDTSGVFNEIAYFVECVRTGNPPAVITPEQSLFSLRLLLTELESARTGQTLSLE